MPRRCCVPNCKGNYDSILKKNNYRSIFLLPRNKELRKKWLDAIPRKDWTPTKYSAVCSLHFAEADIQRYQVAVSPNGTLENVLMRCPRLTENAVPSIFPNCPSYLSKAAPKKRRAYNRKKGCYKKEESEEHCENIIENQQFEEHCEYIIEDREFEEHCEDIIENQQNAMEEFENSDIIHDFADLINDYKEKLVISDSWSVRMRNSKIYFCMLTCDDNSDFLILNTQIVINSDMTLQILHNSKDLSSHDLQWALPVDSTISRWSQLQNLLIRYSPTEDSSTHIYLIESHLEKSLKELNKAYIIAESIDFDHTKNIEVVIDNIKHIKNKRSTYEH